MDIIMEKMSTRMLVEAGVFIALAQILSFIKYEMPYGGSVTLGSMVPIIIFAIRWGTKRGILIGLVHGFLQFALGTKFTYHPLGIFLDYIFAFGCLGLGGLFKKNIYSIIGSTAIALAGRFSFHFLSGVILWYIYAPKGMNIYLYSLIYNSQYMLPEFIITSVIIFTLYKPLRKYIHGSIRR
ncbi:energy-coupled thiamine transporter ThiT [Ruminiclostridium cellulolyticum]|uniref:Proton-coupled thiamine transporter YuaJ n=1 Tax=Ruminiclostridium cellulolyticum (strain ATCC 35319 / DSM 5812 / JCM 6584 / H10) TaxID=394503 RepID=B8I432_RUMCH|nr:energy-coupled thiamine transporter ThiT [Ruminiclostridium cellulolyticum]ACL76465.1 proton-coupled thiamine transporter YuaJ [Ruminiclostridium cellulolyticum H10]